MFAITGMILFIIIAGMTFLVACGFPLGEFIMGGQHRVLPKKFRVFAIISLIVQLFAAIIILQAGGFIPMWFPIKATKYICIFLAAYLSTNVFTNLLSKSKKEKYIMTPLSLIATICFWVTALEL
jgi:uncharacterized membrane protein YozB (DUF420 family)